MKNKGGLHLSLDEGRLPSTEYSSDVDSCIDSTVLFALCSLDPSYEVDVALYAVS